MSGASDRRLWPRRLAAAALISGAVAITYVWLGRSDFFQSIEGATLDWRFRLRGPVAPGGDVVILAIDDQTLAAHGPWPLPRRTLADAVRKLQAAGASVIAFDLLMVDRPEHAGSGDDTEAFVEAARMAGNVILPFAFQFDPDRPGTFFDAEPIEGAAYRVYRVPEGERPALSLRPTGILAPSGDLLDAGHLAHANAVLHAGGGPRFLHPVIAFGDAYFPALPVVAARLHLGLEQSEVAIVFSEGIRLGERFVATDRLMRLPINYYGSAGTIPTYPLSELLAGRVPESALGGRVVFVGATASAIGDRFSTPFSPTLPGVELFATATDNLLTGRTLVRSTTIASFDLIAIFACGVMAAGLWYLPHALAAIAVTAALLAGWAAFVFWSFVAGIWLDATFPAAAIVLNAALVAAGGAMRGQRLLRAAEGDRRALAGFVSPLVTAELHRSDTGQGAPRRQPAAVMFVDMRGFTALSERLGGENAVPLLRDFHRRVERAVSAHRGFLDHFMGDGAMAVFGVPEPALTDPADALAGARRLVAEIEQWSVERDENDGPPISIGIGLHYGPVVIGQIGGDRQKQMTASGDTVNVASRLEALTKTHGARIIASDALVTAVRNLARDDLIAGFEKLPDQEIRGRREHIDLWVWHDERSTRA